MPAFTGGMMKLGWFARAAVVLIAPVLSNLIDETLEIQAAAQENITVPNNEVDAYYQRIAGSQHRTPEAFSAYLHSIGSSDQSLKRQIRGELAWERLKRRQIEPFVNV